MRKLTMKATTTAVGNGDGDLLLEVKAGTSTRGASLLMLTQMVSKLLTFVLNQLLVRMISPTLFGVSAYLDFLYSTILFFSREAVRLSIQRTVPKKSQAQTFQSIINFGFIPFLIGIPISIGIIGWQFHSDTFNEVTNMASSFGYTLALYWLLTIVELLVEPIYAINQYTLNFGKRSKYESLAVVLRCLVTVTMVYYVGGLDETLKNGILLLGFGAGQFVYSLTLFICYLSDFKSYPNNTLKITNLKLENGESEWFDSEVTRFWKISFIQMIFKQILTEGDKFIINTFFSTDQRGVYSVMNNYGSIIVRLLFQPIEESVRLTFTRLLGLKSKQNLADASKTIKYLLIFYLHFSILIFLAGYYNASFLLKILLGGKSSNWLNTGLFELFPYYIAYIPFLAFNGVVEAFFSAAASSKETKSYSYFMSYLSVLILILMYLFIQYYQLGIFGLILANSINMVLRICYCASFICKYFSTQGIPVDYPQITSFVGQSLLIGGSCFYINYLLLGSYSSASFKDLGQSIVVCMVCLVSLLVTVRKDLYPFVNRFLRRKQY